MSGGETEMLTGAYEDYEPLIEQLKEKRLQEYKDALRSEENKLLDEIGLQLYMRRSRQEEHA